MAGDDRMRLTEMLENEWQVVGYSVCLMAMGATSHHTLLQKDSRLASLTVIMNGGKEIGRELVPLSPPMPLKKGLFG